MEILKFLFSVNWQAVSAIMTFFAVVVAFYSSYQYQKQEKIIETREIVESIIHPLQENINSLLSTWSGLNSPHASNWGFKWQEIKSKNPYLIFKLQPNLKNLLDNFDEDLNKFTNLTNQKLPKLKEVIAVVVRNEMLLPVTSDSVMNYYYQGKVGGKHFNVSFLNLLLAQKNLDEHIEELKRNPVLPNTELSEAQFVACGFSEKFSKEKFDEVFLKSKSSVENDAELKNYIEDWIALVDKTKNLAAEIKKYKI